MLDLTIPKVNLLICGHFRRISDRMFRQLFLSASIMMVFSVRQRSQYLAPSEQTWAFFFILKNRIDQVILDEFIRNCRFSISGQINSTALSTVQYYVSSKQQPITQSQAEKSNFQARNHMQYKCRIHYAASATVRTIHIYRRHPVPDKGRVPLL